MLHRLEKLPHHAVDANAAALSRRFLGGRGAAGRSDRVARAAKDRADCRASRAAAREFRARFRTVLDRHETSGGGKTLNRPVTPRKTRGPCGDAPFPRQWTSDVVPRTNGRRDYRTRRGSRFGPPRALSLPVCLLPRLRGSTRVSSKNAPPTEKHFFRRNRDPRPVGSLWECYLVWSSYRVDLRVWRGRAEKVRRGG